MIKALAVAQGDRSVQAAFESVEWSGEGVDVARLQGVVPRQCTDFGGEAAQGGKMAFEAGDELRLAGEQIAALGGFDLDLGAVHRLEAGDHFQRMQGPTAGLGDRGGIAEGGEGDEGGDRHARAVAADRHPGQALHFSAVSGGHVG